MTCASTKDRLLPRACEHPEGDGPYEFEADECEGCLVALIALAVNNNQLGDSETMGEVTAADAALAVLRDQYEPDDPFRVRAERALVPLASQ